MFTPASHQMVPLRLFNDFSVEKFFVLLPGQLRKVFFLPFRPLVEIMLPLHYDKEFLKRIGHEELYAHGFLTLIQSSIGATPLAHQLGENLVGFVEQSSKFLKPVYCGDTLYAEFEIKKLCPIKDYWYYGFKYSYI